MGRSLKLYQGLIEDFEGLIKLGVPYKYAAQALGVSQTSFFRWLQMGEQAKSGIYRDFWATIKRAEAEAVARNISIIEKAAQEGTWQAAAWFLERKHPEEFGRKDKIETEQHHKGDIQIVFEEVPKRIERNEIDDSIEGEYIEVETISGKSKTDWHTGRTGCKDSKKV